MASLRPLISSVLLFSFLASLLHGPLRQIGRADVLNSANNRKVGLPEKTDEESGLQFRLSHKDDLPETRSATKLATASELPQGETENILKRLPAIRVDPSGVQEFALREG